MPKRFIASLFLAAFLSVMTPPATGQVFDGYILYNVLNSNTAYMRDNNGTLVQTWTGADRPASTAYVLDNGVLVRPCKIPNPTMTGGAVGGRVQKIDLNGDILWDYTLSTDELQPHHEVIPMPGGNVALICWHRRSNSEATAAGRTGLSGEQWSLTVVEVMPTGPTSGEIVWRWDLWDHLVQDTSSAYPNFGDPADFPNRYDVNYGSIHGQGGDWIHANGMDYNPVLDQLVISSHYTHEFYVIDHSTTTEEAAGSTGGSAGMGGDILYRWGNPVAYGRGTTADQVNFVLHGVNWVDEGMPGEGNIIWFNNGDRAGSSNDRSSVMEVTPPLNPDGSYAIADDEPFGPEEPTWMYEPGNSFYSNHLSGVFRLPNGNTLATEGTSGHMQEISPEGTVVWDYDTTGQMAKGQKLPTDCLDPVVPCPTDLNGDDVMDVNDVLILLSCWDQACGDVNDDGTTDVNDILVLLSVYGTDCP